MHAAYSVVRDPNLIAYCVSLRIDQRSNGNYVLEEKSTYASKQRSELRSVAIKPACAKRANRITAGNVH